MDLQKATAKFSEKEAAQLAPVMERFMTAYGEDTSENGSEWLAKTLQAEHPEKSTEEITALADKIRQSVGIWDENMASLNEACAEGISKEEWLSDRLQDAAAGEPVAEFGNELATAKALLHTANQLNMGEIEGKSASQTQEQDATTSDEWSNYEAHNVANQLGKEVEVSNLSGMVLRTGWKLAQNLPDNGAFSGIKKVADALQSGNDQEVKTAATAALKSGVEKGLVPLLPKDTSLATISGVACYGVEQAKIMCQFANGDISGRKALEMSGRTAVNLVAHPLTDKFAAMGEAVGAKIGAAAGKIVGSVFPLVAPIASTVGSFVGGVVGKIAGGGIGKAIQKGAQKIVDIAKPVLSAAWEGVKSIGSSIIGGVKSLVSWIFD